MTKKNDFLIETLEHSWGKSPKQKAREKEYNHEYYLKNRKKWEKYVSDNVEYKHKTRGKVDKVVKKAKTKIKDLAKSYQESYNLGMDMVMNFLKR